MNKKDGYVWILFLMMGDVIWKIWNHVQFWIVRVCVVRDFKNLLNPMQQGKYIVFLKDGGVVKTVQKLGRSYKQCKIENNFESPRVRIVVHHWAQSFVSTEKMHKATTHWTNSSSESL